MVADLMTKQTQRLTHERHDELSATIVWRDLAVSSWIERNFAMKEEKLVLSGARSSRPDGPKGALSTRVRSTCHQKNQK
jgi:hypothetical protein